MKFDDLFMPMETNDSSIGTEYDKIQEEYYALFQHNVPRSLLPDSVSDEEIISAMKVCIETKKDTLFELLGVELNDEYLY